MSYAALAARLFEAQRAAVPITQLTAELPSLTPAEGYLIQAELVRLWDRAGVKSSGRKAGLTSLAKQKEVGVESPIFGHLLANAEIPNGGTVARALFIHPRAEPEIVFQIVRPIEPWASVEEIRAAVGGVQIGIEIIDSRYRDFKFTLPDVVADNCSAAGYVLGDPVELPLSRLPLMGVWMRKNGIVETTGAGAAILGDPLHSLVELVRTSEREILPGPMLAGAVTASVTIGVGDWIEVECGSGARAGFKVI
jgi:2-oxo-3-hexenedioate decarboxylase